ncbi:MAG TPA: NAD-dependent epimerase/dehydratase family protein [Steroidobacteraceae bacterium]
MDKHVLIAGASGFVGSAAVNRFIGDGCKVMGLSRRPPVNPVQGATYRSVNLLDRDDSRRALSDLGETTHLIYAAVNETPGDLVASWTDPHHAARNASMLENLLDALLPVACNLQRILLVHGTKAYGVHLTDRPHVPLLERSARPSHDDFYFRQEDLLRSRRNGADWSWTILRAPMIAGGGYGSNLNALLAIGVFAALLKEERKHLCFPGAGDAGGVMEMVDVELLAQGLAWAAASPNAADQVFNIANGDTYIWPDLWPVIAADFGMPVGAPEPCSVASAIMSRAAQWSDIVREHGLAAPTDPRLFLGESAALADFALNHCARAVLTSTIKIRRAGFAGCIDTAESVVKWLDRWRGQRLLPPCR